MTGRNDGAAITFGQYLDRLRHKGAEVRIIEEHTVDGGPRRGAACGRLGTLPNVVAAHQPLPYVPLSPAWGGGAMKGTVVAASDELI